MFVSPKLSDCRSFGTSNITPVKLTPTSSGCAPTHTNTFTMFMSKPKFSDEESRLVEWIDEQRKEKQLVWETSDQHATFTTTTKSRNNLPSLYRLPSKLLFQSSFDKVMVIFDFIQLIAA